MPPKDRKASAAGAKGSGVTKKAATKGAAGRKGGAPAPDSAPAPRGRRAAPKAKDSGLALSGGEEEANVIRALARPRRGVIRRRSVIERMRDDRRMAEEAEAEQDEQDGQDEVEQDEVEQDEDEQGEGDQDEDEQDEQGEQEGQNGHGAQSAGEEANTGRKTTRRGRKAAAPAAPAAKRAAPKANKDSGGDEANAGRKRKRGGNEQGEQPAPAPKKAPKAKKAEADQEEEPRPAKKPRTRGLGARGLGFNEVPSKQFDVFVFGEGSSGELGLGSKRHDGKKPIDVKRPRLNHNLKGVVALACGGMHCIALTHDQRILTWGVNDDRALGRDTLWEGGTRDVDDDSDMDSDDDSGVNPNESTPGPVDLSVLPEGTMISQVAATDSASFILTDDGWVYGWGTFRGSDGIIGFRHGVRNQSSPTIIPGLKNISKLACGSNHVLALDLSGKVFTWGSGGQYQLGRKPLLRHGGPGAGLDPQPCGRFGKRHHAVYVGAGSYHSFYIDNNDQVWAWGLNNYAQTGLSESTGEDDAMVLAPQIVKSLRDHKVSQVVGGEHHSVACTTDGQLLTWGRVDGHQVGHNASTYTVDNTIYDDKKKPRILLEPTTIEGIKATFVAAGTDTSFALDEAGKVYSWGFSANYQTGQGTTDDIEVPTVIDNTAIRDRKIVWAGAGGQFSVVAAAAEDNLPNGH
ncbi:regulator of chromosome condensation 1/beta-lactamase-inhibitor protein II [Hypoxylon crocopeplum]|nr:regulator of chromosome condensation 1/beta-lactamase-inhibitor protein II [Hypoxylon crocopeplum]